MTVARDLELYLVRHAPAAERGPEWPDDEARPLTPDGASKFRKAVAGLAALGVQIDLVLTSPLVRCRQTAQILADGLPGRPRVQALDALAPGGGHEAVISEAARVAKRARVALVGHEPDIGHLAAKLLGMRRPIDARRGAVGRIDVNGRPPAGPGRLSWFATSRMLRSMAP